MELVSYLLTYLLGNGPSISTDLVTFLPPPQTLLTE